jgi:acetate kinase
MHILVVNSGSSSIKFSIYESAPEGTEQPPRLLLDGELHGIGTPDASLELSRVSQSSSQTPVQAQTPVEAIRLVFDAVSQPDLPLIDAVGYRVVHPGPKLDDHQRITPEVLKDLEDAAAFAPLHDPEAVAVIREGLARLPKAAHFACFDTVFHRTMPEEASVYPLPPEIRAAGVHRYGFHGLSCESVVWQMQRALPELPRRMVIAHLGSGCSVTALLDGQSIGNTMGLTPTGGVVMGTRPGDLDPGLMLYLLRLQAGDKDAALSAIEAMLNHHAGIAALSGLPNDLKAVRKAAAQGNAQAQLALKVFTRSVTQAIAGFCWLSGGLDAIVFAGGIGEHDPLSRAGILAGLESQGVEVNSSLNEQKGTGLRPIGASHRDTSVYVVPAQEDLIVAMHVVRMAKSGN